MNPISSASAGLNLNTSFVDPSPQIQPAGATNGAGATTSPVSAAAGFTQALSSAIGSVAGLQQNADQAAAGLAMNNGTDISQAMIAMEQASLGMNMAVTVRDKAVEAYQTLINMQM